MMAYFILPIKLLIAILKVGYRNAVCISWTNGTVTSGHCWLVTIRENSPRRVVCSRQGTVKVHTFIRDMRSSGSCRRGGQGGFGCTSICCVGRGGGRDQWGTVKMDNFVV